MIWLWALMLIEIVVVGVLVIQGLTSGGPAAEPTVAHVDSLAAGSYLDSLLARLTEWPIHTLTVLGFVFIVWLGMWGARRRVLEEPARHRRLLTGVAVAGLGIGLLGSIPQALVSAGTLTPDAATRSLILTLHNVGGMYAGPGYVALFGLIASWLSRRTADPTAAPVTGALVALGRRSLSGYLFQSIVWLALLLPFTLNLTDRFGNKTLLFLLVATVTWLATVIIAAALQRRDRPGPAEYLLRRLTYGRR